MKGCVTTGSSNETSVPPIAGKSHRILSISRVRWEWFTLLLGLATAIAAGPSLLPPLEGSAIGFRQSLEAGLIVVRCAAAAIAVLSCLSLKYDFFADGESSESVALPSFSADLTIRVGLVLVGAVLVVPRLGTSLWWDELITLTRVVDRGPAVIAAFSCEANNHPLNSWICWLMRRIPGNLEVDLHLFPALFFLGTISLVHSTLRLISYSGLALIASLAVATHPTLVTHAVEARGYSGGIFCCALATAAYSGLIRIGGAKNVGVYIAASVAGIGFVLTALLVPFSHGVVAVYRCCRLDAWPKRSIRFTKQPIVMVFACLWVAAISLFLFGLPLPQTLDYATKNAAKDHLELGPELFSQMLRYLTGLRSIIPAAVLLIVSIFGWFKVVQQSSPRLLKDFAVASLAPVAAVAFDLLLPQSHSSPRFFFFLIVPFCCGLGFGVHWLLGHSFRTRILAATLIACWSILLIEEHYRLFTINRPNLKHLADEIRGSRVALVGAQADMNLFYFPEAIVVRSLDETSNLAASVQNSDIIIEGRASSNNRLATPNPALSKLGYRIRKTLPNALPREAEFLIYDRVHVELTL